MEFPHTSSKSKKYFALNKLGVLGIQLAILKPKPKLLILLINVVYKLNFTIHFHNNNLKPKVKTLFDFQNKICNRKKKKM